jgi:hypothetical protein
MQPKKDSTLWDVVLPPDFSKTKEILKDVMTIKKSVKLEEVFEDTLREIEEKNPAKNYDCSVGFMFISMLHVANEQDGNLKFQKTKGRKHLA